MAKDREIVCEYYQCEGVCKKNHEGTFHKGCQKCKDYHPIKGRKPARLNLKRQKIEKARAKDIKY